MNGNYQVYQEEEPTEREATGRFCTQSRQRVCLSNYGAGGWSRTVQELRARHGLSMPMSLISLHSHLSSRLVCLLSRAIQLMRFDESFRTMFLEHFSILFRSWQTEMETLATMKGEQCTRNTHVLKYLYDNTRFHFALSSPASKDLLMQLANPSSLWRINCRWRPLSVVS